jgi:hypothetical protein
MALGRGAPENGAWKADVDGVGSGCHRYYFVFRDADGELMSYPQTGSLGIGPAGSCADWSDERPAMASTGCTTVPEPGVAVSALLALGTLALCARRRRLGLQGGSISARPPPIPDR